LNWYVLQVKSDEHSVGVFSETEGRLNSLKPVAGEEEGEEENNPKVAAKAAVETYELGPPT
jgi:hypothetical protein